MNQSLPKAKAVSDNRITVRNPNVAGSSSTVDAVKYHAMKQALLQALPHQAPGLTQTEMFNAVLPQLRLGSSDSAV